MRYKKTMIAAVTAAGAMDTCSGLLLMLAPVQALRLMSVAVPAGEALIFIRFIGAFVFAVGALYLFAGQRFASSDDTNFLVMMLGVTAWVRTVIFTFTMLAILSGSLSWAWWSVPCTDGLLALLQVVFIRQVRRQKGGWHHELATPCQ